MIAGGRQRSHRSSKEFSANQNSPQNFLNPSNNSPNSTENSIILEIKNLNNNNNNNNNFNINNNNNLNNSNRSSASINSNNNQTVSVP